MFSIYCCSTGTLSRETCLLLVIKNNEISTIIGSWNDAEWSRILLFIIYLMLCPLI